MEALQSPPRDRKRKWWRLNRHVTGNGNGGALIGPWPETEMVALQSPRDRKRKWWRFNRHVTGNGNGCASKSRDLGCFRFTSCSLFCSGLFPDFLIIYCWLYRDIFHCQSPDPVVGRANYILFWVQTLLVADLWFSVGFSQVALLSSIKLYCLYHQTTLVNRYPYAVLQVSCLLSYFNCRHRHNPIVETSSFLFLIFKIHNSDLLCLVLVLFSWIRELS